MSTVGKPAGLRQPQLVTIAGTGSFAEFGFALKGSRFFLLNGTLGTARQTKAGT
jgi:hypothetical protein